MMTINQQMELGFGKGLPCPSRNRPRRHTRRAAWWFDRMRQAVEQAVNWRPAPEPRPEQIWFPQ